MGMIQQVCRSLLSDIEKGLVHDDSSIALEVLVL